MSRHSTNIKAPASDGAAPVRPGSRRLKVISRRPMTSPIQAASKLVGVEAIEDVLQQLSEPDADMIAAGADVLSRALAGGILRREANRLAEDIWCAMLERAR